MLRCWVTNNNVQLTTANCTPKSLIFSLAAITGAEFRKYKSIVEKIVKKLLPHINTGIATAAIEQYTKDPIQKAHISLTSCTHRKPTLDHLDSLYILCLLDKSLVRTSCNPIYALDGSIVNILDYFCDVFSMTIKIREKISERVNTDKDSDAAILFEVLIAWLTEAKATVPFFYKIITLIPKFSAYSLKNDEDVAIIDHRADNTMSRHQGRMQLCELPNAQPENVKQYLLNNKIHYFYYKCK